MKTQLKHLWQLLRAGLWFTPSVIVLVSVGLSVAMLTIDKSQNLTLVRNADWLYSGGSEGARSVLSTIAASMITVAGVAFSVTVVALTLASQQFGSRLLRNFMRDLGNQIVLGTFIATFLYCLLVLRTIHGANGQTEFVPHLSVTVGVFLAIVSLAVLVYFIHHVSASIQASSVIASVGNELAEAIKVVYPEPLGGESGRRAEAVESPSMPFDPPADVRRQSFPLQAGENGYLQAIDSERLMRLAVKHNVMVKVAYPPGRFIMRGMMLAVIYPLGQVDRAALGRQFVPVFILGKQRTLEQDLLFGIHQMVEIAVRALSPGVNDPTTAMFALNQIGATLSQIARQKTPSAYRYDEKGALRVVAEPLQFIDFLRAGFDQLRRYGKSDIEFTIQYLTILGSLVSDVSSSADRQELYGQAKTMASEATQETPSEEDKARIQSQLARTMEALKDIDASLQKDFRR